MEGNDNNVICRSGSEEINETLLVGSSVGDVDLKDEVDIGLTSNGVSEGPLSDSTIVTETVTLTEVSSVQVKTDTPNNLEFIEVVKNPTASISEVPIVSEPVIDTTVTQCVTESETVVYDVNIPQKCVGDIVKKNESAEEIASVNQESEDISLPRTNNKISFETEIVIEKNDVDRESSDINNPEKTNHILNELGQNLELSEALCSSDVTEHVENNNCTSQQVFNKEELLEILEGNDVQPSGERIIEIMDLPNESETLEAQIALQQLSKLNFRKRRSTVPVKLIALNSESKKKKDKEGNHVNELVKDWDDDDVDDKDIKSEESTENVVRLSDQIVACQEEIVSDEQLIDNDSSTSQDQTLNQVKEASQLSKRQSRIIKKKVIFDPDNPDTFATKGKSSFKVKEIQSERELKIPNEINLQRPKSKSPTGKLKWKKPSPKNSKQIKRLTEIDKLLMDEGAVNMIYQLTPEAPKGKKNVKTKAEFIKKIQSSTPDSKEMKFRDRKKELIKFEEGEAKRILSSKQRISLSSSVKSPSVSEDFETHSADDSIIYRRHSSSSYSSACMSPRRLSDVDSNANQNKERAQKQSSNSGNQALTETNTQPVDVFMSDITNTSGVEIINKNDCLTIKQKLNSKLTQALKKKKRESLKTEKQANKKKNTKKESVNDILKYDYLSVTFYQNIAEICIKNGARKCNLEALKELNNALAYIENKEDVSITLLTSESGSLCSDLNFETLKEKNVEKRSVLAYEFAETIRLLLCRVEQHDKLLCSGVWSKCSGVALALVALCDIAVASEDATFTLTTFPGGKSVLMPGVAVFTAHNQVWSQGLIKDLIVFGRRLSANEAMQGGLINRVLWPNRFDEQVRAMIKDIASQPVQGLLLKKQLLRLKKNTEFESTFLSCLEAERDLLAEYWTSEEGQMLLQASADND